MAFFAEDPHSSLSKRMNSFVSKIGSRTKNKVIAANNFIAKSST